MEEQINDVQTAEAVDLDLDLDDARLREAVGQPTTVRIDGMVIHIAHVAEWSVTAMRASSQGDWETWASETIADDKERQHFLDADLLAYQMEAVFERCARAGGVSAKKSKRSRH